MMAMMLSCSCQLCLQAPMLSIIVRLPDFIGWVQQAGTSDAGNFGVAG